MPEGLEPASSKQSSFHNIKVVADKKVLLASSRKLEISRPRTLNSNLNSLEIFFLEAVLSTLVRVRNLGMSVKPCGPFLHPLQFDHLYLGSSG